MTGDMIPWNPAAIQSQPCTLPPPHLRSRDLLEAVLDERGLPASVGSDQDEGLLVLEPGGDEDEILLDLIRLDEGRVDLSAQAGISQLVP